ncbi:HNH endonuclease [Pseudonocardia kunmingensis]|uniref:HNH endonuclease n=1 Tax=Pseudonocardia kunmingensis TaxID=630975 RepID=UPI001B8843B5|nr:DUF222 domain-containing protein [Pseudonocardia kunmingensis]
MFEARDAHSAAGTGPAVPVDARVVAGWVARLGVLDTEVPDAERVDQLRALEELKAAAAAAQARIALDLDTSQRAAQAAAGVPANQRGRGVAAQIALARRESAFRGARHLGLAKVLVNEMPHTLAALERGLISEWRATLLARETACLSLEHRRLVDARLAADPSVLDGWGDRQLIAEIQKMACELDVASVARRRARAESERRVTCRPAPDAMALLSGLLPAARGIAVWVALRREADSRIAHGDGRTRGQLMADILVERVTGQADAAAVPVEIHLVMTDCSLLGDDSRDSDGDGDDNGDDNGDEDPDMSAHLAEYGPIPAGLARRLAVSAAEAETAWLRRLYTAPGVDELVGMDSTRRTFPPGLARFIRIRDQFCRTPWCGAPIRHIDHALPHGRGGATSERNGEGLCEQCNYDRQAPGWDARAGTGSRHTLQITTPTGHTYITTAPRPPGDPSRTRRRGPRRRRASPGSAGASSPPRRPGAAGGPRSPGPDPNRSDPP